MPADFHRRARNMSRPIALDVLSSAVCVESPGSAGSRGCRWPKCSFLCTRASAPRRCWERSNSARRGPSWCLGRSSCVRAERRRVRACSRATPRQASPLAFLTRCALQTGSDASCDTADAWQGSVSRGPRCSALHTHPGTPAAPPAPQARVGCRGRTSACAPPVDSPHPVSPFHRRAGLELREWRGYAARGWLRSLLVRMQLCSCADEAPLRREYCLHGRRPRLTGRYACQGVTHSP